MLRLRRCPKIQEMALQVLLNVTGSTECIDDIAANHVLVNILHVLYTLPEHRVVGLDLLYAVVGDTRLVKECLQFGKNISLTIDWGTVIEAIEWLDFEDGLRTGVLPGDFWWPHLS